MECFSLDYCRKASCNWAVTYLRSLAQFLLFRRLQYLIYNTFLKFTSIQELIVIEQDENKTIHYYEKNATMRRYLQEILWGDGRQPANVLKWKAPAETMAHLSAALQKRTTEEVREAGRQTSTKNIRAAGSKHTHTHTSVCKQRSNEITEIFCDTCFFWDFAANSIQLQS